EEGDRSASSSNGKPIPSAAGRRERPPTRVPAVIAPASTAGAACSTATRTRPGLPLVPTGTTCGVLRAPRATAALTVPTAVPLQDRGDVAAGQLNAGVADSATRHPMVNAPSRRPAM